MITRERLKVLVVKDIMGELPGEEAIELDQWGRQHPAHRSFLDLVGDKAGIIKDILFWRSLDVDQAYARWVLRQKIDQVVQVLTYSTAACLFFLAGWLWLRPARSLPPIVQKSIPAELIHPGRNTARLTLADGRGILLDSVTNGELPRQGKTRLNKPDSASLAYTTDSNEGEQPVYNILSVPRAGQYKLILPDGTRVWLNSESHLKYPASFNGSRRVVTLTGEAYFEVNGNTKPFIVQANGLAIQVLGTNFNVMAYGDEDSSRTTLIAGKVKVIHENKAILLKPGQQVIARQGGMGERVQNVDPQTVLAWKNGRFIFPPHTDFQTVLRQVTRWYNVQVEWRRPFVNPTGYHGSFERSLTLQQALPFLKNDSVHLSIEGNHLVISR